MTEVCPSDDGAFGGLPVIYLRATLLLLIKEQPSYGYDLAARLRSPGVGSPFPGLYKLLRALEKQGAISSDWEFSSSGPARRIYRITPYGDVLLAGFVAEIHDAWRALAQYLDRYREVHLLSSRNEPIIRSS
jgi:PadR family transcriptional regulator PadR